MGIDCAKIVSTTVGANMGTRLDLGSNATSQGDRRSCEAPKSIVGLQLRVVLGTVGGGIKTRPGHSFAVCPVTTDPKHRKESRGQAPP